MSTYGLTGGTPYQPTAAGPGAAAQTTPPPPATRPSQIIVSIGPAGPGAPANVYFKSWVTLPLTPSALPTQVAGLWQDNQVIGGGERSSFGGAANDMIGFTGTLEPPAYYAPAPAVRAIAAYDAGALASAPTQLLEQEAAAAGNPINTGVPTYLSESTNTPLPGIPALAGGTAVVMQEGGQGVQFVQPLALNLMLIQACKTGEIIRLVMGDEYGYNSLVTLRSYTWKFEDPDPDTLNFEFNAKSWTPRGALVATAQSSTKKAKHTWHQVQDGEDLLTIAAKAGMGTEQSAINTIIKLNVKLLGSLWVYPDSRYGGLSVGRNAPFGESAGLKSVLPPGAKPGSGHEYGATSAKHFDSSLKLRHGFKLRLK